MSQCNCENYVFRDRSAKPTQQLRLPKPDNPIEGETMSPVNNNASPIAQSWNIATDNVGQDVESPAQTPPELVLDSPLPACQKSDLPPGPYGEGVDGIGTKMNLTSAEPKGSETSGSVAYAKGNAAADSS